MKKSHQGRFLEIHSSARGHNMNVNDYFEYIGVAAFAVSGAYVAIKHHLDMLGIYVIAFTTACGGGILRDAIMDEGVPVFFSNYSTIAIVMIVTTLSFAIKWNNKKFLIFMQVCDAIGLAAFAVNAGIKAIELDYNFPQFIFVSTITAVGGGVIRDLLCQRVPVILREEVYALCAIIGSIFLWFAYPIIGLDLSVYSSIGIIVAMRLFSYYKKMGLYIPHSKNETPTKNNS